MAWCLVKHRDNFTFTLTLWSLSLTLLSHIRCYRHRHTINTRSINSSKDDVCLSVCLSFHHKDYTQRLHSYVNRYSNLNTNFVSSKDSRFFLSDVQICTKNCVASRCIISCVSYEFCNFTSSIFCSLLFLVWTYWHLRTETYSKFCPADPNHIYTLNEPQKEISVVLILTGENTT